MTDLTILNPAAPVKTMHPDVEWLLVSSTAMREDAALAKFFESTEVLYFSVEDASNMFAYFTEIRYERLEYFMLINYYREAIARVTGQDLELLSLDQFKDLQ